MPVIRADTRDGLALRTHRWEGAGPIRAHVLLVHGIAEHASRHRHVAARLGQAGLDTHAYDLRGFGDSGGARAYVERWSRYHDDLEDQLAAVQGRATPEWTEASYPNQFGDASMQTVGLIEKLHLAGLAAHFAHVAVAGLGKNE